MSTKESQMPKRKRAPMISEVHVEKMRLTMGRFLDVTTSVLKNPMGLCGVAILAMFFILAIFGPQLAPYDTTNLELGKWKKPSEFASDPPPSFEYLAMALPGVLGIWLSALALFAAFVRVPDIMRLNKMLQVAGMTASSVYVALVSFYFLEEEDAGSLWWIYALSLLGISLAMASLGTRKRIGVKRKRMRYAGLVASVIPVALMFFLATKDLETYDPTDFLFVAYILSGASFAAAGALFIGAYKKPPAVEAKLMADGHLQTGLFPAKLVSLTKAFSVAAGMLVILTGILMYLAGNWTTHWMGTSTFGSDIFSELLYGARTSMVVGVFSAVIASVLGAIVGLYSGYVGGWVDEVIMRANDVVLSIPWLVLMIIVAAMLGKIDLMGLILIIGFTGWSPTARMVRAQVLSIRERQYIERARAIGSSDLGIIRRHVLPNSFPLVFANTILTVAVSILSEATLSFLGMRPIGVVTWGTMLSYASSANAFAIGLHWWIIAPGMCIVVVVLGFTLLGYALDDILNPKLRKR